MPLGGRSWDLVRRSVTQPEQYVALGRMVRRYPAFPRMAKRYFLGGGDYPYVARVRTPRGVVRPTLWSHHDVFTVNEIFCREDYAAGRDLGVVVDVGSNIGISALYFLTRNATSRVWCYEPVPRNAERLRRNLTGFEDRYRLEEVAVADRDGELSFGVEPTGRYGGLGVETGEAITVRVRAIGDVLREVLAEEERIDLLKLDTEGAERDTVAAIPPDLLPRIGRIAFETETPFNPFPERYDLGFSCETATLSARSAAV